MALRYVQRLPPVSYVPDREQFIVERCRGRRVLHLGFVAQGGQDEQIACGQWLHAEIANVASKLIGVDLDAEGVGKAQASGYAEVYVGDAERLRALPVDFAALDVVVAGELIEHVRNVGQFLTSIADVMTESAELIVTTPNALSIRHTYFPLTGREVIHPDHRCIFSPTTLSEALRNSGLLADKFFVYSDPWAISKENDGRLAAVAKRAALVVDKAVQAAVVSMFPYFASGLIVTARKAHASANGR